MKKQDNNQKLSQNLPSGDFESLFVCYPKCTTCQKSKKWLDDNGVTYTLRDIKLDKPTAKELNEWIKASGLPIRKFFNTSGLLYKEHNMKDKVSTLPEKELIDILASDGMMVKRPILITDKAILIGFREEEWKKELL